MQQFTDNYMPGVFKILQILILIYLINYPSGVLAVKYFKDILHHTIGIKSGRRQKWMISKS